MQTEIPKPDIYGQCFSECPFLQKGMHITRCAKGLALVEDKEIGCTGAFTTICRPGLSCRPGVYELVPEGEVKAIKKMHNGYDSEMRKTSDTLKEPATLPDAVRDLIEEERTLCEYETDALRAENERLRNICKGLVLISDADPDLSWDNIVLDLENLTAEARAVLEGDNLNQQ